MPIYTYTWQRLTCLATNERLADILQVIYIRRLIRRWTRFHHRQLFAVCRRFVGMKSNLYVLYITFIRYLNCRRRPGQLTLPAAWLACMAAAPRCHLAGAHINDLSQSKFLLHRLCLHNRPLFCGLTSSADVLSSGRIHAICRFRFKRIIAKSKTKA
jgi:hypothetical protein